VLLRKAMQAVLIALAWAAGGAVARAAEETAPRENPAQGRPPAWVEPMREVHARFSGTPGTLALWGDSITISLAFWAPLAGEPRKMPPEMAAALARVKAHQRPECWRDWRGPEFGNNGRMTIRWAHQNIDAWLQRLNPEAAVIMFGTNDLGELERGEYEEKTRQVVGRALENGTVVLLTTPPPRHGLEEKAAEFAESVRGLARELRVPLIDYHAEILKRRPRDWNGALAQFAQAAEGESEYDVPTLIARDGVHPSNPRGCQDYSEKCLRTNGFALRNYLTVLRYAEVIERVLQPAGPHERDNRRRPQ
jgi:lysophospholipase L1-like esterase